MFNASGIHDYDAIPVNVAEEATFEIYLVTTEDLSKHINLFSTWHYQK